MELSTYIIQLGYSLSYQLLDMSGSTTPHFPPLIRSSEPLACPALALSLSLSLLLQKITSVLGTSHSGFLPNPISK
jgi:hypothetical protein